MEEWCGSADSAEILHTKPWAPSLAVDKTDHADTQTLRQRQEDQKSKILLSYTASLRPAWAT